MGEYEDFIMKSPVDEEVIAGICHARGVNKDLPAQWLMYIVVENLDKSLENCIKMGGKVLGEKRKMGEGFYCLIQDPAGAHVMLSE
jgi:predicted enzyme related to lactoylglutathione lyase